MHQQQQQQQQPASDGKTTMPSTAVTVQPVHNFLEDRHAIHGQAVCDTAHDTAHSTGPLHRDRAKSGKPSPKILFIADVVAASSDMTHAEEEEEASSCGQHSSSSAPPHRADADPSAPPNHTVKEEEDLTRSRNLFIHNNAAGASSDHTADSEEDEGAGRTDKGLPTNDCSGPLDHVPADVIAKWGHVLDIVTPHSTVTNCFTKTYSRFAKVHVPHLQHTLHSGTQSCTAMELQTTSACCMAGCATFLYNLHLTQPCDSIHMHDVHRVIASAMKVTLLKAHFVAIRLYPGTAGYCAVLLGLRAYMCLVCHCYTLNPAEDQGHSCGLYPMSCCFGLTAMFSCRAVGLSWPQRT